MKEKTLGDFIFETLNPVLRNSNSGVNKGYVCGGCRKHFDLDELFLFKDDEATKWLCDRCLRKRKE